MNYVLYGYLNKEAQLPEGWKPERPKDKWAPFGRDARGTAYRNPAVAANLTPAGTPKTRAGTRNLLQKSRLRNQKAFATGYGNKAPEGVWAAYRTPGEVVGDVVGEAYRKGKDFVVEEAREPVREMGRAAAEGAEEVVDEKIQQWRTKIKQLLSKYGPGVLGGGASLAGLLALLMARRGGGGRQPAPQGMPGTYQSGPMAGLPMQRIYR